MKCQDLHRKKHVSNFHSDGDGASSSKIGFAMNWMK